MQSELLLMLAMMLDLTDDGATLSMPSPGVEPFAPPKGSCRRCRRPAYFQ